MEFKVHQHRLTALSSRFHWVVMLTLGLVISNLMMVGLVCYTTLHRRIEITPFFGNMHYEKSDTALDASYLRLMSENFLYARLNVTPEIVKRHHQHLLKFVDASHFKFFSAQLEKEAELIIDKKISSHIEIHDLTVDVDSLTCHIQGVLKRAVGQRTLPDKSLQYALHYRYQLGQLFLIQFTQEKSDEKN